MAAPVHTQFAMAALDLADLFKVIVGSEPLASSEGPSFKVELSAPDGPSTGGGAQSVQHIRLAREGMTVVAGSIDAVQKECELRSFDYANGLHVQRYKGGALPITRVAYDAMLKRVRDFAAQQGMTVVLKDAAPVSATTPPKSGGGSAIFIAIFIIGALAGAAYWFTMRH